MKTQTSPAIIMRTNELGESDLLVTFFTRDRGRLKGVAKGARRSRRRFVNSLDLFSLVEVEYSFKGNGGLHFIHSARLIDLYPGLRADYAVLGRASYMIELTEILFPWELPDKKMFDILNRSFQLLTTGKRPAMTSVIFEIMAMSLGGYGINLEKCCGCGRGYRGEGTAVFKAEKGGIACMGCERISTLAPRLSPATVRAINMIQTATLKMFENPSIPEEIVSEIKPLLRLHREYHLGKRPRTACYLE